MPAKPKRKAAPVLAPLAAEQAARDALKKVVVAFPPVKILNPDGSITFKPGKPVVLQGGDEISTAEAARILDCTPDWVSRLCDRGELHEGRDWRRTGKRGNYRIKRSSVLKLRSELVVQ